MTHFAGSGHKGSLFFCFSRAFAQNRSALKKLGITHILNAAHSKQGSIGDECYYGTEFVYYGIPAEDSDDFDISVHFRSAAEFIHKALKKKNGMKSFYCGNYLAKTCTDFLSSKKYRFCLR